LARLEQVSKVNDVEISRLLGFEMVPFAADEQAEKEVSDKLKQWLVNNAVQNDPQVRDAVGRAIQKRRQDAPAGARGTR